MELIIEHKDKNLQFSTLPKYIKCDIAKIDDVGPYLREHLHLDYEIVYVRKGSVKYYINHSEYLAEAGDLYIVQPKQLHKEISLSKDLEYYYIEFYFLNIKGQVEYIIKDRDNKQCILKAPKEFEKLFSKIYEEEIEEKDCRFIETALLYMIELIKKELNIKKNRIDISTKSRLDIINKVVEFIENNKYSDLTLNNLSKYCCISSDYLAHVFKEATGSSILKYAMAVKLEEAKELILNSNKSIKQISEELGFSNPYHFSKVFKKHMSIAPSSLKKQ